MTFDAKAKAKDLIGFIFDSYDIESHIYAYGEETFKKALIEAYQTGKKEAYLECVWALENFPSDNKFLAKELEAKAKSCLNT